MTAEKSRLKEEAGHTEVFFVDLDRTLIYSYKSDAGNLQMDGRRSVELYRGREISFITQRTYELLQEVNSCMLTVPTTTRTSEQYQRIDLGVGRIKYALTCNGGVLLAEGSSDESWYQQSLQLAEPGRGELEKAVRYLEAEKNRELDVRLISELFVFTKCRFPEAVVQSLKNLLDVQLVDVFHNGEKIYVVPAKLNKGTAAARFREYIGAQKVYAAGDSIFDLPMLEYADAAAAPSSLLEGRSRLQGQHICKMPGKRLFSEEMLEFVLRQHFERIQKK